MRRFLEFDWLLFLSSLFLLGMGLLSLYSLSPVGEWSWSGSFFLRQALFGSLGILVMFFVASIDYRHIGRFSTPMYFLSLGALLLVVIFGRTVRGTAGWIEFGPFQFQPVEGAKIVLIIFLASFIAKKSSELGEWVRIIASFVLASALVFLVLKQPDLGSALVLSSVWAGMILVSGVRVKHVLVLAVLGTAVIVSGWFFLEDYQKGRIEAFIDPESDPRGSGYNVLQSMIAVGSGGFFGKGLGYGSQSQLNFLPEKHTDFLVAVIAEELGLFGLGVVIFAYGLLLYRIGKIAMRARDNTGYLIGIGAFTYFFFQISVNVGMNIGAIPVTGLPAPFLSYGGSSLLASFVVLGLVLSVHRRRRREELLPSGVFPGEDGFSRETGEIPVFR
ncbi:MAG: rod shape-determining protein RodA [Candidatus Moranbacteria bacterium]|nr:rod shape-determining protein RodA [Candidatus Moranbacteria bacterium]